MQKRRFLTFKGKYTNEEVDLELPADKPVGKLIPDLLKTLNWPTTVDGSQELKYHLETEQGEALEEKQTLQESGVENADVLRIVLADNAINSNDQRGDTNTEAYLESSPQDRRGSLSPPRRARIPITKPSLVSKKGYIYVLGQTPIIIGRGGGHSTRQIDLSEIDVEMIASRKHAKIRLRGNNYTLRSFQTTNGTFVNGVELQSGEDRRLEDRDVIQFGFNKGVKLTFRMPE